MALWLDVPEDLDSIRPISKSDVLPSQSVCRYTGAPGPTRYYLMRCPICLFEGHAHWDLSMWNIHMLDAGHAAYQNVTGQSGVEKVIRLAGTCIVDADHDWWEVELRAQRAMPAGAVPAGLDGHGFAAPASANERERLLEKRGRILDMRERSLQELEVAINARAEANTSTEIALVARQNALVAREGALDARERTLLERNDVVSAVPTSSVRRALLYIRLVPETAIIAALFTVSFWFSHGGLESGLGGLPWTSIKRIIALKQRAARVVFDENFCTDPVAYLRTFCERVAREIIGRPFWVEFLAQVVEGEGAEGVPLWAALDKLVSVYSALFVMISVVLAAWRWSLLREQLQVDI